MRASWSRRLAARVIDMCIVGLVFGGVVAVLFSPLAGDPSVSDSELACVLAQALAVWALGGLAYFVGFTAWRGQTPGKEAMGLRVIGPDGGVPGWGRALVREVAGRVLSAWCLGLGYLWAFWEREGRCWHDLMSGTRVADCRKENEKKGDAARDGRNGRGDRS